MSKTAAAIINDFYDAWRAQELEWLASYLPDDFSHAMLFPIDIHPSAGTARGKRAAIERWRLYIGTYDILRFDTSGLIADKNHAAVEIGMRYRHKATGSELITTKANFWTLVDGWPVQLTEYYDVARLQDHVREVAAKVAAASA